MKRRPLRELWILGQHRPGLEYEIQVWVRRTFGCNICVPPGFLKLQPTSKDIPCSHTIKGLISLDQKVTPGFFDAFWLFHRPPREIPSSSDFIEPLSVIPEVPTNPLVGLPHQAGEIDINTINTVLLETPVVPPVVCHLSKYERKVVRGRGSQTVLSAILQPSSSMELLNPLE